MTTHPESARRATETTGGTAGRIITGQAALLALFAVLTLSAAGVVSARDGLVLACAALTAGAAVSVTANVLMVAVVAPWRRQRAGEVMARTAFATIVKFAATVLGFAVVLSRWDLFFPLVLMGWLVCWSCYIWVPLIDSRRTGTP